MPTVSISASELKTMLKREVSDSELEEILPLNKMEIEEREGDEIRIEVTPDRPDLYSVEGIARQLNSWLSLETGLRGHVVSAPRIEITTRNAKTRPFICAAVVRETSLTDSAIKSIMQLQELLDMSIGRDRKKAAIGIHDLDRIRPPLLYTDSGLDSARFIPLGSNQSMTPRDVLRKHEKGIQYAGLLSGRKAPLIFDQEGVISFPPIINSDRTRVTTDTKNLFIEITGTREDTVNTCLNIIVTALEMRDGKIEAVKINNKTTPVLRAKPANLDTGLIRGLLGQNLKEKEIKELLERMGYGIDIRTKRVFVPPYRADVLHPVDIAEDVAVACGYNNITPEMPRHPTTGKARPIEELSSTIKEIMTGLCFQEMMNFILTSRERLIKKPLAEKQIPVEIENPVTAEYSVCRTWLLPGLFANLASNKHRRYPQKLFEIADAVVEDRTADTLHRNRRKLAAVVSHSSANLSEIISISNAIAENLGLVFSYSNDDLRTFVPGRRAAVICENRKIGVLGEVHPEVLVNFELKMPVAGLELDVDALLDILNQTRKKA